MGQRSMPVGCPIGSMLLPKYEELIRSKQEACIVEKLQTGMGSSISHFRTAQLSDVRCDCFPAEQVQIGSSVVEAAEGWMRSRQDQPCITRLAEAPREER